MPPPSRVPMTADVASYLVHHVVLPPKLPQKDDYNPDHEQCLLDTVIHALQDVEDLVEGPELKALVTSAVGSVTNLYHSRDKYGGVSELELGKLLHKLAYITTAEMVPLEIKAQNAGLILSRSADSIAFEPFELSPVNGAAIGTAGRLVRKFPGGASEIPISLMKQQDFRESLAHTLAKMSTQIAPDSQPLVRKNGQDHEEDRDTTDPLMITDWLMNYIAALGKITGTVRISKNTREEVLWNDCRHPWRRSPMWLLVRVTLQLLFSRHGNFEQSLDGLYKVFLVQLLSRILNTAKENWDIMGSEVMYIIYAKMVRRLRKLEHFGHLKHTYPSWSTDLRASMVDAHTFINKHWAELTRTIDAKPDIGSLHKLEPAEDVDMALPQLNAFLGEIAARRHNNAHVDFRPDATYPIYPSNMLPTLDASGDHQFFRLAAVEAWVEQHLQSWLPQHLENGTTCGKLLHLMKLYHSVASTAYVGIPTGISVMYLSLLELWIACDKSACQIYPLLVQYDPELDITELQCLVLPLKSQMQRLAEVERYVQSRRDIATAINPSVFQQFGHPLSFAVRYFDESDTLQALFSKIERDAADKQKQKRDELARLKLQYKDLMDRYNSMECETRQKVFNRTHGYTRSVHSSSCTRCAAKNQAASLTIKIYEWPLSSKKAEAKATVFEIQPPQGFIDWRDASMFVRATVLGCVEHYPEKPLCHYTLDNHHDLAQLLSRSYSTRRVVPLSSIKSHTSTHRSKKTAISNLQDSDVCLPNALRYAYYDEVLRCYTSTCQPTQLLVRYCMYQMPDQRYKVLQGFLHRPPSVPDGRAPNAVIASLSECPPHFSLEEFKSFGMLPAGRNIVYSNILTQLATPSIDFAKAETQTLILQIVEQSGVPDGLVSRVSHGVLMDPVFCNAMLEQLEISLLRVSKNWESWRAVAAFSTLSRRILSLNSSAAVCDRSLVFLAKARQVTMTWFQRLKSRASASMEDDQRSELNSRATEIALLCTQTYDVEDSFLAVVLQQKSAISTFLQCSIVIQDNHKLVRSDSQVIYKTMLQSWMSLQYRAFTKLRQFILQGDPGLHDAVHKNWADYQPMPEVKWNILSPAHEHWLFIKSGSLKVYFNVLTADLRVNGLPLARLPSEFMEHPLYDPLFGKSILEVVPTGKPGMKFSAKSTYRDYKLHFGKEGEDIFVVAVKDNKTFDLLPSRVLQDHLPFAFKKDYIHWYDHNQGEVIFRPRTDPWAPQGTQWKLVRHGLAWRFVKDANILVNISSQTARTIWQIFSPVEDSHHIHAVLDTNTQFLHIHLPRLQLEFYIEHGDHRIQSRQYRGMTVDPVQSMGTLVGLTSKLILSPVTPVEDRLVLIPVPRTFGPHTITCVCVPKQHHVSVKIDKNEAHKVFAYSLDVSLGRVLESGDVQRRLFLAFLHALTSHCLPDLLTGYTGTESALNILQSAAVHSFEYLSEDNVDLLHEIAALSPLRSFYPKHLMDMQHIRWTKRLPALSQHPQLFEYTMGIIKQAQTMSLFYPDHKPNISSWESSNIHLEARDAIRASTFRVCGFGASPHTSSKDVSYKSRDVFTLSERGQRAHTAATLIVRNRAALTTNVHNLKSTLMQSQFKSSSVSGGSDSFDPSVLRFDSKWLGDSASAIRQHWCNLHRTLPAALGSCNDYNIMAWLSTMAFAKSADMCVLQAFAAFYRSQALATVKPPSAIAFNLSDGSVWVQGTIELLVRNHAKSFDDSAESRLPKRGTEIDDDHIIRIENLFQKRLNEAVDTCVTYLKQQWPCANPAAPTTTKIFTYVNISSAMPGITAKFATWHRNRRFEEYLLKTSDLISQQTVLAVASPRPVHSALLEIHNMRGGSTIFGRDRVFSAAPPIVSRENVLTISKSTLSPPCEPSVTVQENQTSLHHDENHSCLEQLCGDLETLATSKCEKDYVKALRTSCTSLENLQTSITNIHSTYSGDRLHDIFQKYLDNCKEYFQTLNSALAEAVAGNDSLSGEIGLLVQHSPRISPTFWLGQLHCDRFDTLPGPWKTFILEYGLAVTQLHRAQRLLALYKKPVDLIEELGHVGHSNWSPSDHPETLLLEAESSILIRKEQEFIASQMRGSKNADNTVLQLLMGGGKSSTIVPMLAAYLGDKKKLVRIITAKPQSKQMLHMLVSKLGYLLNRRVYHMPFSRSLRPSPAEAATIRKIYEDCILNRGVLLIQPEHILSFKLMTVEAVLAGQACAKTLLETQEFFDKVSRDIVDESDENFSVKFELVYTIGSQRSIEFAPERWIIIQAIVGLIPRFARQVNEEMPDSIDVQRDDTGRFPRIRILRNDAGIRMLSLVAKHVVEFGIIGLPTSSQPPTVQAALFRYITETELTASEIAAIERSMFWTVSTKSPLLLVRGLLAGGILHFALGTKRWRVNFGLDPGRVPATQLAVPFRSKDCPSPRSEFSHPDVVILLSLLSYYYGGLTDEQLFDSFAHLLKSDQGSIQYDEWVATASSSLPIAFRQLSGVSIKDRHQCIFEVFPALRYSKKAIDYYLAFLVFPKAMKEFPQKLSASGWDIGAIKAHPVTGFSGTNDTLHLLPLTVKHLDLPSQSHTNALVLRHLLQEETSVELLPPRTKTDSSDAEHLLSLVVKMQPEVRVILDCGASILEQNNKQVAETWLKIRDSCIQAVVFFDDEELSVLDRAGRIEPLQTSPFAKQLDVCLVYLDEAHTRGTDLKLPRNYRAAVTLGQGLVKDKLTQGCMRMRKLGVGQSVAFIVPEEISTKIRERTGKKPDTSIQVSDVLCWSVAETWQDLKQSMPLWAVQGERAERNKNLSCGAVTTMEQATTFLEDEAQTLEARYRPLTKEDSSLGMLKSWDLANSNIGQIVTRCREFEAMGFGAATLSEEQERELAPEIEEERQIERPAPLEPENHTVHPDITKLVNTGILTKDSSAVQPAFRTLSSTSAAKLFNVRQFPRDLLATVDFTRTVKRPAGVSGATFVSDSYQRPVQFMISVHNAFSGTIQHLIIISPMEANQLYATIRKQAKVTMHIFAPRANAAFASLDKLELYNVGHKFSADQVSRSLTIQLNLFTGSLYLRSFEEYVEVCDFLGLLRAKPNEGQRVHADGFIDPPAGEWALTTSPVPFLRTLLMKIRREGEGVEKTHMGKILNGLRLEEADFKAEE